MRLLDFTMWLPQFLLGGMSMTRRPGGSRSLCGIRAGDKLMVSAGKTLISPIIVDHVVHVPVSNKMDPEEQGWPRSNHDRLWVNTMTILSCKDRMFTDIWFRATSHNGVPACGTCVSVKNDWLQRAMRKPDTSSGVVIAHVQPGEAPLSLKRLILEALALPGRARLHRSRRLARAIILNEDGRLSVVHSSSLSLPSRPPPSRSRLLEPACMMSAADIVMEHTTSASVREMALVARRKRIGVIRGQSFPKARHGVSTCWEKLDG